jgi:hypothetical protein
MSDPKHRLLKPLRYPEFTVPAMLCLLIGAAFLSSLWVLRTDTNTFWTGVLLLVTSFTLMLRTWVGTVLLTIVLGLALVDGWDRFEWSANSVLRGVLSSIFLLSMIGCLAEQEAYHRLRRKPSPSPTPQV